MHVYSFLGGSDGKESVCHAGDLGSIPGSGSSLEEGHGNPLQYSCLENPMDRGPWWATVCRVVNSRTRLSDYHFHSHVYMDGTSTLQLCLVSKSCPTLCDPLVTWSL